MIFRFLYDMDAPEGVSETVTFTDDVAFVGGRFGFYSSGALVTTALTVLPFTAISA